MMMMRKWRGGSYRNIPVAAVTINVTTTLYHDHHRWLEQDSNKPGIAQEVVAQPGVGDYSQAVRRTEIASVRHQKEVGGNT